MPLYDYICNNDKCETNTFEVITSFNDITEKCPNCKEGSKDRKKFYQYNFKIYDFS